MAWRVCMFFADVRVTGPHGVEYEERLTKCEVQYNMRAKKGYAVFNIPIQDGAKTIVLSMLVRNIEDIALFIKDEETREAKQS